MTYFVMNRQDEISIILQKPIILFAHNAKGYVIRLITSIH